MSSTRLATRTPPELAFLAPENIKICTRAEEKENLQAEQQLFDPLVMELARDDKLLKTIKMMLLQYVARKIAEEDPIDWDKLAAWDEEEEVVVQLLERCCSCPDWTAIATAYEMKAGERATFYLDYDHDEIMVYYSPADNNDDGPLTPDYDPNAVRRNVELAS
ncbi:hypothetical protein D1007_33609 [Hordeum vulgare]|nr:hypothetical protein D1007_33609 [Hordeum vulgare]